jgi:TolB protein
MWTLYFLVCVPLALNQLGCKHDTVVSPDNGMPTDTTDIIDMIPVYDEPCDRLPLDETVQGKILFSSRRSGDHIQLYVMNPDGSDVQQLTFGDYNSTAGRWSKDGSKIVFLSDSVDTSLGSGLYIMNADGSNIRPILSPEFSSWIPLIGLSPDWSPDGQRIVYLGCFNCDPFPEYYLFVVNVDGTNLHRLYNYAEVPVGGVEPSWSPDGSKIAFTGGGTIYVVNADGTNPRKFNIKRTVSRGVWSPDGCKIAFIDKPEGGRLNEIFYYDLQTDSVKQITFHTTEEHFSRQRWSPDGKKLVFQSLPTGRAAPPNSDKFIYTVNIDGTGLTRITDDPTSGSPDWSWHEPAINK